MFPSHTRIQLFSILAVLSSSVAASDVDARATSQTLPDIFKSATSQIASLTQQINRSIVFNKTLTAEPTYVESLLGQVGQVVTKAGDQVNQIGKLPFDQISGGLTQSDIQYLSTDFLTAVVLSVNAPKSVVTQYPEIQKSIDGVESCMPIFGGWLCYWFPWLCWWGPWLIYASASFTKLGLAIAP
ncbi:hypothetical protein M407DRAFT_214054 [Tulasnella calospora MUT 4182]|uniref:Uncharacterized protein n=1 Tax=Tulasnella calospora MUT 4182 TaxID=1051891 RepID=A0A0C3LQX9_9AGAM|nr:hypothetical protein M407DRAFT_214054 [Tulasnella calospora MUT 4182]